MGISPTQLLIILVIVALIFGTKKLKNIGGDLGGAVKGFKKAVKDDEKDQTTSVLLDDKNLVEDDSVVSNAFNTETVKTESVKAETVKTATVTNNSIDEVVSINTKSTA